MHSYDPIRAEKLIQLALHRFDSNLKEAEIRVLRDSADSRKQLKPISRSPEQFVRAEFLRWLATDQQARPLIDSRGIRVYAATITGRLDLESCGNLPSLWLRRCRVLEAINLEQAETNGLYFVHCSMPKGFGADMVLVHGPIFLDRVQSGGIIRLTAAEIRGQLNCRRAKLTVEANPAKPDAPKPDALVLEGAVIRGSVSLAGGFLCTGIIKLIGAQIDGFLDLTKAKIDEIHCVNMRLGGNLFWEQIDGEKVNMLNLSGATVKTLQDDRKSWPEPGHLMLDRFLYEKLSPPELDRVDWLMRQPELNRREPQPWMQLSKYLDGTGEKDAAKKVIYRFRKVEAGKSQWPWSWFPIPVAWLEESPKRILYSIGAALLVGTLIFAGAHCRGSMIPTGEHSAAKNGDQTKHYPPFNAFVYTLENAVPLVKLGMDDKWTPDPGMDSAPAVSLPCTRYCWICDRAGKIDALRNYWFLATVRWVLIYSGWFQAAILGAALTSRFKA